jgi:alanine or glycine:cation symporter, AGCS family
MIWSEFFLKLNEGVLLVPFVFLLFGSIILTFKTRFIQFRALPRIAKLALAAFRSKSSDETHTIRSHRALFTAMSSSLGIGNILSPVIAIGFGGPGALVGFILAMIFGCATIYTEVTLSLHSRERLDDGTIMGGPMQYLRKGISPFVALIYALGTGLMLVAWSGRQSNTLAVLLSSKGIPTYLTGFVVAIIVAIVLLRGIKTIGTIAAKLVPTMFILYTSALLWVIFSNIGNFSEVVLLVYRSLFTPNAMVGAGVGVGILGAMRWGLSNAFFANEAGLGTATIPHSMARTENPVDQGTLAMVSVYTSGIICILSGVAILLTGVWKQPGLPFDITMLFRMFTEQFSYVGGIILTVVVFLFAFGAMMGNSYNGGQCVSYITKRRWIWYYYIFMAVVIFFSATMDMKNIWVVGDWCMAFVAVPHIISVILLAYRNGHLLAGKQ